MTNNDDDRQHGDSHASGTSVAVMLAQIEQEEELRTTTADLDILRSHQSSMAVRHGGGDSTIATPEQPTGVGAWIEKQKASTRATREWYDAQHKAFKAELDASLRVYEQQLANKVRTALAAMDSEMLARLGHVNVQNADRRDTLLRELMEQTNRHLLALDASNVLPILKKETMAHILAEHRRVAAEIAGLGSPLEPHV